MAEQPRDKHWLIFTPFRYTPPPPGSRFRAPTDPGVFYGAFERRTACAEIGFWRWRFVRDSEAIVYESVRDPEHGGAVAVLTPGPLNGPIGNPENWFLTVAEDRVIRQRELGESFQFTFGEMR